MKITGIILLVLGIISMLGAFAGAAMDKDPNFSGLIFIVLGAFLISRANKKKEEEERKSAWVRNNTKHD